MGCMSMSAAESELVETRLRAVFSRVFGKQVPYRPDLRRADEARWTSLKHVELLVAIEKEFGLRFDGADAMDMSGVDAILQLLQQRVR
jgi:acyl carrier protein